MLPFQDMLENFTLDIYRVNRIVNDRLEASSCTTNEITFEIEAELNVISTTRRISVFLETMYSKRPTHTQKPP
jgi:hypothetical protein